MASGSPRALVLVPLVLFAIILAYSKLCPTTRPSEFGLFSVATYPPHDDKPDLSRFVHLRTLDAHDLGLDRKNGRIISIGDVHGMNKSLHRLLDALSYDPHKDTLIHHGDFLTKGADSNAVLSYFASNHVIGVRGNQDQAVLEWRSWIEWIEGLEGGRKWLEGLEKKWHKARGKDDDLSKKEWLRKQEKKGRKHGDAEWWKRVPKDNNDGSKFRFNKLFSEHYYIAKSMSEAEHNYLLSLPLILHAPDLHTYFVHGGLLPYRLLPTKPFATTQPLAHVPSHNPKMDEATLRLRQEVSLLHDVPENQEPWNVLNIRSVKRGKHVSRDNFDGVPWSNLWNHAMERCDGFNESSDAAEQSQTPSSRAQAIMHARQDKEPDFKGALPCMPITVVYGHAATRGRDIKRWSMGLDSGCAYGQRLTALVLGAKNSDFPLDTIVHGEEPEDEDDDDDDDEGAPHQLATRVRRIKFGDRGGKAHLVSVRCHV